MKPRRFASATTFSINCSRLTVTLARYSPPGRLPRLRRGDPRGQPTSPRGGEVNSKLDTPHPARPLRGRADLPTRWGGEFQARYPHPVASRAFGAGTPEDSRPPHVVGR